MQIEKKEKDRGKGGDYNCVGLEKERKREREKKIEMRAQSRNFPSQIKIYLLTNGK